MIEVSYPTMDNEFIDTILKIPPEMRMNHNIQRKFLKKLCPDLDKIPYNKTMVRADAPYILWKIGEKIQEKITLIKNSIYIRSHGKIFLRSKKKLYKL